MAENMTRRGFLAAATVAGIGCAVNRGVAAEKPALLGGQPVRRGAFPSWPIIDQSDDRAMLDVLRSRKWYRGYGNMCNRFEQAYAALTGAKHCIATANGTSSLFTSLAALGVGPGDEVILPPYTFIATLNVVILQYALPVFVDTDPATFQIDASKIESAINDRTAAIMPVHIGGNVADLDTILAVARRRKLPVVEDGCQAHMAEWRGRKVGTWGDCGCFSFQASKNLNCGEGGAILCNDADLAQRCYAFHNNCRPRSSGGYNFDHLGARCANLRMTEFQAALLLSQMTRLEEQSKAREQNAQYLTKMLGEIPGIQPARMYEGCTRNSYHLYMFRYQKEQFAGLSRSKFLQALNAEGIPCSGGYSATSLHKEPILKATLASRAYRRIYSPEVLQSWEERNACPQNDKLCQEAVWFAQTMFIGPRGDMDHIADAIRKIHDHAAELAKA